jgi:hypothetical protein
MDADSSDENPTTGTSIVKKKRAEVMLAKDADEGNNTASDIHRLVRIPNAFFVLHLQSPAVLRECRKLRQLLQD